MTIQRYIHTSPRKLRLVADLVRGMKPAAALNTLRFVNKAAAKPLAQAIKTVLANAKAQNQDESKLVFKKLEIDQAVAAKRMRAQARGHRSMYTKKASHIKVVLTDEDNSKKSAFAKAVADKGGKNGTKN